MTKINEKKAVIYARATNYLHGQEDYCIECQLSDCLEYCDARSLTVVSGHFDIGSTMASTRPGLDAIYDLILSGLVDAVVVTSLNRIFRTRSEASEFFELLSECDVTLHVKDLKSEKSLTDVSPTEMQNTDAMLRARKVKNGLKTSKSGKAKVIPKGTKKK